MNPDLIFSAFTFAEIFYVPPMTKFPLCLAAVLTASGMVLSCAGDDVIPLAGTNAAGQGQGEALFSQAKAFDEQGNRKKAIRAYRKVADQYPLSASAPEARFREAELLKEQGDVLKSFDAYQKFLTSYQGSGMYSRALEAQARMAQAAADGEVKKSFAGLRTRLDTDKVAEMLGQVRDNAPRSDTSAKAQFTMGELYQSRNKPKEAIEAYQKLVRDQPESRYSAEALFRVGVVRMEQAERGNQNRATLDLAQEAFQDYLLQYPGHAKNAEAKRLSNSLKGKDLGRSLEIAQFYDKAGQYESAKIYYRDVVKNSKSGRAHDVAKARLKELGE